MSHLHCFKFPAPLMLNTFPYLSSQIRTFISYKLRRYLPIGHLSCKHVIAPHVSVETSNDNFANLLKVNCQNHKFFSLLLLAGDFCLPQNCQIYDLSMIKKNTESGKYFGKRHTFLLHIFAC